MPDSSVAESVPYHGSWLRDVRPAPFWKWSSLTVEVTTAQITWESQETTYTLDDGLHSFCNP